ncbi:hypothetical protein IJG89_03775 [Candidatus Saccharibacteria bacterium]|nr:hypothetical protein [Candidatus Saccharibacteria bacterium]
MNKLFSLVKATMSEGMQIIPYRFKGERSRLIPTELAILVSVMIFMSAYGTTMLLKEDGTEYIILALYVLATTILTIMEGVYKSGDLLFNCRDNDMLLSMPIKKSTIVFTRVLKFYIFEMIYNAIFLVPAILAYALNTEVSASYILVSVVMILLLPAIPIAISCVVGAISSAISARFRQKSALQVLLSFLSLVLLVGMTLAINAASDFDGGTITAIGDRTVELYYPAGAFTRLATDFNWLELVQFILINLTVIAVTVFMIGRFYFQIVTRVNVVQRKKTTNAKYKLRKRGQVRAMVHKELVKYFNTPVLLANTALGLVLFVVGVGLLCFKFDDVVSSIIGEEFPLTLDEIKSYLPGVTFAMVSFTSLMTFITTTMISLEGRAFNLLKSMPISGLRVITTKILAAMLIITPVTALGSLVMAARFGFGLLDTLLVIIGVIAIPLVTESIGILIDLRYARFHADSETEVVKQSPGVMISSFLGLGMTVISISLLFVVVLVAGQTAGLAIMDGIFVAVFLMLYLALASHGEQKYLSLTA